MTCRHCGAEERASEGYPCARCGTFLCIICTFRGYTLCAACEAAVGEGGPRAESPMPPTLTPTPPSSASP